MCKYMTGTEPPGARWEDYQGEGAAKAADAQLQPPASEPKEAEGHKEDEGADNKGGQGKGGWLVGAAAEESGKAGEGASMQQRLGGRGFLGSVLSKLKSDRPQ